MAAPRNAEAVDAFVPILGECEALLAALMGHVDDHLGVAPDGVSWGHVADSGRVRDLLREAAVVARIVEDPSA